VTCAVTLCVFNVFFMVVVITIFLTKLTNVYKGLMSTSRKKNKTTTSLINVITKTTLLSLISMTITFLSCLVILFRFILFGDSQAVIVITEWLMILDIYSNFACYTLQFEHSKEAYKKMCSCLDIRCKHLWYRLVFGENDENEPEYGSKVEASATTALSVNGSGTPIMSTSHMSHDSYSPNSPKDLPGHAVQTSTSVADMTITHLEMNTPTTPVSP